MTEATSTSSPDVHAETLAKLSQVLGADGFQVSRFRDNTRIAVKASDLLRAVEALRNDCGYTFLVDLGASDYLNYPGRDAVKPRFEVHYVLLDPEVNRRFIVKVGVEESHPVLPTLTGIWLGANWMEREIFDMFGIKFDGHPDLRRILMPDEFTAHPLRKDYPLRGRGERHNFPRLTRGES